MSAQLRRRRGHSLRGQQVDADRLGTELHDIAVREQPGVRRIVDQWPDLAQAPAQGTARVIRHVPEDFAQPLPPVGMSGQSEIRQ
jgi:hypothetical protein